VGRAAQEPRQGERSPNVAGLNVASLVLSTAFSHKAVSLEFLSSNTTAVVVSRRMVLPLTDKPYLARSLICLCLPSKIYQIRHGKPILVSNRIVACPCAVQPMKLGWVPHPGLVGQRHGPRPRSWRASEPWGLRERGSSVGRTYIARRCTDCGTTTTGATTRYVVVT
jgi:hypothetical protein